MRIIEANIIQFGKFKDCTFTFDKGFNIVKGDNESGKSTLLAFIKFALYGVGRKNPNIEVGERERALSWNVGIAAGSLTLEDVDGKKYRIERSKMLLNMTEDSISDVALKCGFNGFSYFSKIFKETVGKSPSQYRKNKKAKKAADERR